MSTFVIDTHALLWYLDGDSRLSPVAASKMDLPDVALVIPTIVLAEAKHLIGKRKVRLSFGDMLEAIEEDERCTVYPFDFFCVERLDDRLDLHDGIIAATALVFREFVDPSTALVTRDKMLRKSGVVETVW